MASLAVPSASGNTIAPPISSCRRPLPPKSQSLCFEAFTALNQSSRCVVRPTRPRAISENTISSAVNSSAARGGGGSIVVIDNYVSNLCQYLGELGSEFEVYRNDELIADDLKEIVLKRHFNITWTGYTSRFRDIFADSQRTWAYCTIVWCVCGIAMYWRSFGSPFTAARYHSIVIEDEVFPSDVLEVTARTADGLVMAARHKVHRHLLGVQFHPESIITTEVIDHCP